jgi:undecaprenyl-diphosphatase
MADPPAGSYRGWRESSHPRLLLEVEERVNDYLLSVILGIIEGLTEFLPVSSTGHMRIFQELSGIDLEKNPFWEMYTIVIQIGAILALPVYFWGRIVKFLATFPRGERGQKNILTHPVSLTLIAFVCTAVPALILTKYIKEHLRSPAVIGYSLLIGGIVMWIVDLIFGKEEPGSVHPLTGKPETAHMEDMTLWQAIWIGLVQVLSALFPGTSRSMSTIAAGQIAGMTRSAALEFSFFLSMPTMAAAVGYEFYKTVLSHKGGSGESADTVEMTPERWIVLAIGLVVSFVVALGVVHWFMAWVRKHGFTIFAVYRIVVGAAFLLWLYRLRH